MATAHRIADIAAGAMWASFFPREATSRFSSVIADANGVAGAKSLGSPNDGAAGTPRSPEEMGSLKPMGSGGPRVAEIMGSPGVAGTHGSPQSFGSPEPM